MSIKLQIPNVTELKPRISVIGVGGAGGNAINNMIDSGVDGVDFLVANTDAQALAQSRAEQLIQLGVELTEGLGAGSKPEIGAYAAEEAIDEVRAQLSGAHMVFVAAGMGGGTGTGAAPVIARAAHDLGILTVGVVTKPFHFEGNRRMKTAEAGIDELAQHVDTLIVIPNQNLFRIANERTTFAEAFVLADQVLHAGIACITDLIVREGLINLDFADVRAIMLNMGTAMMGTGEGDGERRASEAAEVAISNPLLDEISMQGAKGLLVSISGSSNMTLYEVDEAASRVREEADPDANIIVGATFDDSLGDRIRVSIVASGLTGAAGQSYHGASASVAPASSMSSQDRQPAQTAVSRTTATPPVAAVAALDPEPLGEPMALAEPINQPEQALDLPPDPTAEEFASVETDLPPDPTAGLDDEFVETPGREPLADHDARSEPQSDDDDVTIELGVPTLLTPAPTGGLPSSDQPPQFLQDAPAAGTHSAMSTSEHRSASANPPQPPAPQQFRPQPPVDVPVQPSRMPDIEAFPQHAQREYEARKTGAPTDSPVQARRGSLFGRLTGRSLDTGEVAADRTQTSNPNATASHPSSEPHQGSGNKKFFGR